MRPQYEVLSFDEADPSDGFNNTSRKSGHGRLLHIAALSLAGIATLLATLRYFFVPVLTYYFPGIESYLLDTGLYGAYPIRQYVSTDLTSPYANVVQMDASCNAGLTLLSVEGQALPGAGGPMIMDMTGELVWTAPGQFGEASANTKVQHYGDQNFITFWAGEKLQESGRGSYYMLDSAYNVAHIVSAVGDDLEGDLHEFKVTDDGSALITIYQRTRVEHLNTTAMGLPEDTTIVDGIFQAIDIGTGNLLFEWRASEHVNDPSLQSSFGSLVADGSLDYFHMNSIDKDSKGNYLVSLRHLHTLVYIDGITGEILWTLGQHAGNFADISGGEATSFQWQHDARWISEEEGIISLFDNGMAHKHKDAAYSQGLIIQLDFVESTASLLQSYKSRDLIRSPSQGDVQILSHAEKEDSVFIGWGASAAFTEHSLEGDLLCETHFGASWLFYFERVKSYRAFKTYDWRATPSAWDPEARVAGDRIYVSWNGATEVAYWVLQARHQRSHQVQDPRLADADFDNIDLIVKGNVFESSFALPASEVQTTYRIAALNADHVVLRYSNQAVYRTSSFATWLWPLCILVALVSAVCCFCYLRSNKIAGRWGKSKNDVEKPEYHALQSWEPA